MNQARTRSRSKKSLAYIVGVSAALGGTGCAPSNSVKSGAPVILSFGAVDSDGNSVSLTTDAASVPAPPLAHFVAVFDRVLDGDSLEDADGGVPKAGIAGGQYVGSLASPLPVPLTTTYVPNGDSKFYTFFPQGPSLTVSPICGLPTGASVQISVELAKLRSHDLSTVATPDVGVSPTLAFTTEVLAAAIQIPAPLDPDPDAGLSGGNDSQTVVDVKFNDSTPGEMPLPGCMTLPSTTAHIHASATLAGVPVLPLDALVTPVAGEPGHWTVSPPGTTAAATGSWPAGALVTVTVDATATDNFGTALGAPMTASFVVRS